MKKETYYSRNKEKNIKGGKVNLNKDQDQLKCKSKVVRHKIRHLKYFIHELTIRFD